MGIVVQRGSGGGSGGAPTNARYVVVALDGTLSAEEVLTGTTNQVIVTSGGAGGNIVLSTPQSIATTSRPTFAGIVLGSGMVNLGAPSTLTISGGVVTATQTMHAIDTESSAATDDLDTINGGTSGDLLILKSVAAARDVVCKDGTGNLVLAGDFTLSHSQDRIILIYDGTAWIELSRSDNS